MVDAPIADADPEPPRGRVLAVRIRGEVDVVDDVQVARAAEILVAVTVRRARRGNPDHVAVRRVGRIRRDVADRLGERALAAVRQTAHRPRGLRERDEKRRARPREPARHAPRQKAGARSSLHAPACVAVARVFDRHLAAVVVDVRDEQAARRRRRERHARRALRIHHHRIERLRRPVRVPPRARPPSRGTASGCRTRACARPHARSGDGAFREPSGARDRDRADRGGGDRSPPSRQRPAASSPHANEDERRAIAADERVRRVHAHASSPPHAARDQPPPSARYSVMAFVSRNCFRRISSCPDSNVLRCASSNSR